MSSTVYSQIARTNVVKNRRFYIPRVITEAGLLSCTYIMSTMAFDKKLLKFLAHSSVVSGVLMGGTAITMILSIIIMIYVNSFLMKQRLPEFGLYHCLGMGKKHIGKVLFHESVISSIISIILGMAVGLVSYKFCSLLICNFLKTEVVKGFSYLTIRSVLFPIASFAVIDIFNYLICLVRVRRLKSVELLSLSSKGEKEPRIKWAILILGMILTGVGYYISITTQNPMKALLLLFVAILLVIAGTYSIFVSGTIFVLKILKRNEKFYYKPTHLPAVSGMLFRMKQNAVGLASICVLSTFVLVILSVTITFYRDLKDYIECAYEYDTYIYLNDLSGKEEFLIPEDLMLENINIAADKVGLEVDEFRCEHYYEIFCVLDDGEFVASEEDRSMEENAVDLKLMSVSAYEKKTGEHLEIGEDEVVLWTKEKDFDGKASVTILDREYKIKDIRKENLSGGYNLSFRDYGAICSDAQFEMAKKVLKNSNMQYSDMGPRICLNFTSRKEASLKGKEFMDTLKENMKEYGYSRVNTSEFWKEESQLTTLTGSLLFIGIMLGIICIFATGLIIYFKQISEGYDDRDKFKIMERIGMSKKETQKTIGTQVKMVFFLPLVVATIHTCALSPILIRSLKIAGMIHTYIYFICAASVFIVFALIYMIIYSITSKTYYNIVRK